MTKPMSKLPSMPLINPKGKNKPRKPRVPKPVWTVTADYCDGALTGYNMAFESERTARITADWLHSSSGTMNVKIEGPGYKGQIHDATEADREVGYALAEILEHRAVGPVAKYLINEWMDSKAW